jgi:Undecaprenyl-phosphate galactose phosphotransferase WbaP
MPHPLIAFPFVSYAGMLVSLDVVKAGGQGKAAAQAPSIGRFEETAVRSFAFLGFEWHRLLAVSILLLVDWLTVLGSLAVVWLLRDQTIRQLLPQYSALYPFPIYLKNLYLLLPWIIAFAEAGLYTRRTLFWGEARRVIRACSLAALFAIFLTFVAHPAQQLSRLVIAGMWFLTLFTVPLVRYNTKRALLALGLWGKRVLILGAGETGAHVYERIRANPALGYDAVAFADDDPQKIGQIWSGLPVRGPLATVPGLIRELGVRDVVVAMPRLPRERLLHVISTCEGHVESIRVVPDVFGLATVGVETEDLDGMLLLNMRWNLAKPWNLALKRLFDLVLASATAVVLAPLLALTALAIRLDSRGPALFVQNRLGRRWRQFPCLKFRTMYLDNDQPLQEHLAHDAGARAEWKQFAKLKSFDPRVTRVGHILRRLSLDELPQLFNVLRGDMSLVGPRPYLPSETQRMGDFVETILKAPPGLTGLWQVSGRNQLTFDQRLRLDEYYVRNWSLWMDIIVLVKTISTLLQRRGAF